MIKKAFFAVLLPVFTLADGINMEDLPEELQGIDMSMINTNIILNENFNEADHFAYFESDEHFRELREASLSKLGENAVPGRFSWLFDANNFPTSDPFDMTKLEALHQLVQQMQISGKIWTNEPNIPETERPIFLTQQMYEELFWKGMPKEPWMIAFVKKNRSHAHLNHSDWVANTFKILAEDLKGKVRFAFVDVVEEELLKEAFDVKVVPTNFLIVNGSVYETQSLQLGYKPIREYVTGQYLSDPSTVYQTFLVPMPFGPVTLRLKYVWNHYFDGFYVPKVYGNLREWLIEENYYHMYPIIHQFFTMLPHKQALAFALLVFGIISIQVFFLGLICSSCCAKPANEKVAPKEKPANKKE